MVLLFKLPLEVSPLLNFPKIEWEQDPSEYWVSLCNQLQNYEPPNRELTVRNLSRKWELVSAYQKSVRRGLTHRAQWLVGGFMSFDIKELTYFWRRICTTACEDIGPGDVELMNFVIACSKLYPSKVGYERLYKMWCFLTQKMCETQKSRIYCQLSIIEGLIRAKTELKDELTVWETELLKTLRKPKDLDNRQNWAVKNNWRGEGMLKFQAYTHLKIQPKPQMDWLEPQEYETLAGIPDFAYDMHTRVGKAVCIRLSGWPPFKTFFTEHPVTDKAQAIGWALFFNEGGLIQKAVADLALSMLEQKFVAAKFGISLEHWLQFMAIVRKAIYEAKIFNKYRLKVIAEQGYGVQAGIEIQMQGKSK